MHAALTHQPRVWTVLSALVDGAT